MARSSQCPFTVGPSMSPAYIRSQLSSWIATEQYASLVELLYKSEDVIPSHDNSQRTENSGASDIVSQPVLSHSGAQAGTDTKLAFPSVAAAPALTSSAVECPPREHVVPEEVSVSQSQISTAEVDLKDAVPKREGHSGAEDANESPSERLSQLCPVPPARAADAALASQADTISAANNPLSIDQARENALLVLQGVENWLVHDMHLTEDDLEHKQQKEELQLRFLASLGYDVTRLSIQDVAEVPVAQKSAAEQATTTADLTTGSDIATTDNVAKGELEAARESALSGFSPVEAGERSPWKNRGSVVVQKEANRHSATSARGKCVHDVHLTEEDLEHKQQKEELQSSFLEPTGYGDTELAIQGVAGVPVAQKTEAEELTTTADLTADSAIVTADNDAKEELEIARESALTGSSYRGRSPWRNKGSAVVQKEATRQSATPARGTWKGSVAKETKCGSQLAASRTEAAVPRNSLAAQGKQEKRRGRPPKAGRLLMTANLGNSGSAAAEKKANLQGATPASGAWTASAPKIVGGSPPLAPVSLKVAFRGNPPAAQNKRGQRRGRPPKAEKLTMTADLADDTGVVAAENDVQGGPDVPDKGVLTCTSSCQKGERLHRQNRGKVAVKKNATRQKVAPARGAWKASVATKKRGPPPLAASVLRIALHPSPAAAWKKPGNRRGRPPKAERLTMTVNLGNHAGGVTTDDDAQGQPDLSGESVFLECSSRNTGEQLHRNIEGSAAVNREATRQNSACVRLAWKAPVAMETDGHPKPAASSFRAALGRNSTGAQKKHSKRRGRLPASKPSSGEIDKGSKRSLVSRRSRRSTQRRGIPPSFSAPCSSSRSSTSDNTGNPKHASRRPSSVTTCSCSRRTSASDNLSAWSEVFVQRQYNGFAVGSTRR